MKKLKEIIFLIILILINPLAVSSAEELIIPVGMRTTHHEIVFKYPTSLSFNDKIFQSAKIEWGVAATRSITLLGFWELRVRSRYSLEKLTSVPISEFTSSLPDGFYQRYSEYFKNTILGFSLILDNAAAEDKNLFVTVIYGINTAPVYPANFPEYYNNIDRSSKLAEVEYVFKYIVPTLIMYNYGIEISYHHKLIEYSIVNKHSVDLVFAFGKQVNGWFRNYYYHKNFYPCMDLFYAHIGIAY